MSSNSTELNSSSEWKLEEIVSIILVCIIFFALSGCCGIFNRLFCGLCRACNTRNQVPRRVLNEFIPNDPSMQLQSRGLDFSVVKSLPMSQFEKNEGEHKRTNVDCAICLGEFEEGEWLKHLPNCSHSFHVSCIDTWFQSHSNCPLCRSFVHDHHLIECSVSSHTFLETSRREDFFQERVDHYQSIFSENHAIREQQSNPG
ncbi:RING-H2 finger protein ATL66-like [Abrus precatorius]|uniref:RING-type E3 ubiquitin transferase n=1 Tax=Abrus precatorius TaxID=3816 RepID=A0A8B8KWJ2_ABRPR|nr:RING-H2 finger protein ATL66-like [Abrus precatorius]